MMRSELVDSARINAHYICWACGREVFRPVVKRRRERLTRWPNRCSERYGIYHYKCKARWDA